MRQGFLFFSGDQFSHQAAAPQFFPANGGKQISQVLAEEVIDDNGALPLVAMVGRVHQLLLEAGSGSFEAIAKDLHPLLPLGRVGQGRDQRSLFSWQTAFDQLHDIGEACAVA